jgi:hypothetical protein
MVILSVVFICLGLLMLIKPDFFWTVTESWKSNDATEPSKIYVVSTRFGGSIFTVIGFAGIYVFGFMA